MKILILLAAAMLLVSCTNLPPIQGEFISKNGQLKIHPNGRFEIIVEPRSSK